MIFHSVLIMELVNAIKLFFGWSLVYLVGIMLALFIFTLIFFNNAKKMLLNEHFDSRIVDQIVVNKDAFAKRKMNFDKFRGIIPDGDIAEYFYIRDVMNHCGSKANCTAEVNKTLDSLNYSF